MSETEAGLDLVRKAILDFLGNRRVDVYLFGSWAAGRAGRTSDIDVALLPHEPVSRSSLADLREQLEEVRVPFVVDLVDLRDASATFPSRVLKEAIRWNAWTHGLRPPRLRSRRGDPGGRTV